MSEVVSRYDELCGKRIDGVSHIRPRVWGCAIIRNGSGGGAGGRMNGQGNPREGDGELRWEALSVWRQWRTPRQRM